MVGHGSRGMGNRIGEGGRKKGRESKKYGVIRGDVLSEFI
jgi:hypothetical protein